jgi:hypothetical protein
MNIKEPPHTIIIPPPPSPFASMFMQTILGERLELFINNAHIKQFLWKTIGAALIMPASI